MADIVERFPVSVGTSDSLDEAVVTLDIPELKVSCFKWFGFKKTTNAQEKVTFDARSFDFELEITDQKKKIKYKYVVKKLPGEIIPEKCEKKLHDKKVVLKLKKAKEESWEATLASSGLDLD